MGGATLIVLVLLGLGVAERHYRTQETASSADGRHQIVRAAALSEKTAVEVPEAETANENQDSPNVSEAQDAAEPKDAAEPEDPSALQGTTESQETASSSEEAAPPALTAAPKQDALRPTSDEPEISLAPETGTEGSASNLDISAQDSGDPGGVPVREPSGVPATAMGQTQKSNLQGRSGALLPALPQMVGQMLVVGFKGDSPDDPGVAAARKELSDGVIGGVMLLAYNVKGAAQVSELNASLRSANKAVAPLIAVDQEGGKVQRLSRRNGFPDFPSAWAVAHPRKKRGSDPAPKALDTYSRMAKELEDAGFNVNFGPVVDLNVNRRNPIIGHYGRSFDKDPQTVIEYARAFATAHHESNILISAKHFPGHGSSRTDSHKGLADISATWRSEELAPFRELAKDGSVDMVMVGHLYHPDFSDAPGVPASLSAKAIDYIRAPDKLGFRGVVVSDDMEMGALRNAFGAEESVVRAVNAGVDLLVFSNAADPDPELGARMQAIIVKAVGDGRIPRERIVSAYQRITDMKRRLVHQKTAQSG